MSSPFQPICFRAGSHTDSTKGGVKATESHAAARLPVQQAARARNSVRCAATSCPDNLFSLSGQTKDGRACPICHACFLNDFFFTPGLRCATCVVHEQIHGSRGGHGKALQRRGGRVR